MQLKKLSVFLAIVGFSLACASTTLYADPSPLPSPLASVAASIQGATVIPTGDFITDVLAIWKGVGTSGIPVGLKIAGAVLLLIALMKVSFLQSFWDKLNGFKALLAPLLGLVFGFLVFGSGTAVSLASIMAYISAGGGAVVLHELLDAVKAIPGIGGIYVTIINLIESVLGGGSAAG